MTQAASGARGGCRPPGALALPIAHYADNATFALHNQPTSGPYIVSAFSTFALGSEIKRMSCSLLRHASEQFALRACTLNPMEVDCLALQLPTNVHYYCKTGNICKLYCISKLTGKSTSVTYNYDSLT